MSRELDIPLVCTNDVHYTYAEDAKPHDILLCIQTGKKLSDENRMRYEGGQYFVKSEEEMKDCFLCVGGSGKYTANCRPLSCGNRVW